MNRSSDITHNGNSWLDQQLALARQHYRRGDLDAALDLLIDLGARQGDDARPYLTLADLLIDNGQFNEASAALMAMPEAIRDPAWQERVAYCLGATGDTETAAAAAERMLERAPGSATALNLQGMLAADRGDAPAAEALFRRAAEADPSYGEPWVHLGTLYWEAGHSEKGLDHLEQGFRRAPISTAAVTRYHAAVSQMAAWDRAEPVFAEALKAWPDSERIRCLHIDILLRRQRFEAAMNAIEAAMAVLGAGDGMLNAALQVRGQLDGGAAPAGRDVAPLISLCMIVRNECSHLARCLASAKPVVDEIVVVDTGSTDSTADVARAFGARVVETEWDRDFSRARNLSLEKATGAWILVLDADEALSGIDHGDLRDLVQRTEPGSAAFSLVTRNYMHQMNALGWQANDDRYRREAAGSGWFPSEKVRLFPNAPGIRFVYPVHELVEPTLDREGIPVIPCPVPVHHYGKLDIQRSARKGEAYFRIGLQKVDEMAGDSRALKELAIQAMNLERFEDAAELWRRLARTEPERADTLVNLGSSHWHCGRYAEARDCARRALALAPELKEARYNLANSLLHLGTAEEAVDVLSEIAERHPDYLSGRFLLAAARCCTGRSSAGKNDLADLRSTALGPGLAIACDTLVRSLAAAGQPALARRLAESAAEAGCGAQEAAVIAGGEGGVPAGPPAGAP